MRFKEKILEVVTSTRQKLLSFDDIAKQLGLLSKFDKQALASALNELVREDKLVFSKRNKYMLPDNAGAMKATIIANPNGYAFARPIGEGDDVFIAERDLNGATHGDTVLVKMQGKRNRFGKGKGKRAQGSRPQGEVISILSRGYRTIVGYYKSTAGGGIVVPDDTRFADSIFVPASKAKGEI